MSEEKMEGPTSPAGLRSRHYTSPFRVHDIYTITGFLRSSLFVQSIYSPNTKIFYFNYIPYILESNPH